LASTVLTAVGVCGQDTENTTLSEIVVTAQKREEDLQAIPFSIDVLTERQLIDHQVASFVDYAKLLPSVSYQTLGPGQSQIYVRGIATGGDGLHAGSVPTVGVYLDEIPVTTIGNSLDIHMYDIARVEALAGPQGTLYGASSLSGTIRIITNVPDPTRFMAGYDLKVDKFGRGRGGGGMEGFANIPIAEGLAVRLVGYYEHVGGNTDNVATSNTLEFGVPSAGIPNTPVTYNNASAVRRDFNPVDTYGGRAALKIDLDDHWTMTPQLLAQGQQADGDFLPDPSRGIRDVADYLIGSNTDRWYQAALTIEGKIQNWDLVYSGGWFERDVNNVQDYSAYTIAYDYLAQQVGAQSNYVSFYTPDKHLIADPFQYEATHDEYSKMSHELRISSPGYYPVRVTTGLFYQRQTDVIRAEFRFHDLPAYYAVDGSPNVYYLSQQTRVDRDYAVFSDLRFDISPRVVLGAGIRKFWYDNTLYGFFGFGLPSQSLSGELSCDPPVSAATIVPNYRPCVNTNKKVVGNGETHRVSLTLHVDSDRLVYALYSTGFRPGGNNRRVGVAPYGADTVMSIEAGWKTTWWGERLRFNGDAFFARWKSIQSGVEGIQGIGSIVNIGDAAVKGAEMEIGWKPTKGLSLSVSGSYTIARTLQNLCNIDPGTELVTHDCTTPAALAGSRLPVAPLIKANGTVRWSTILMDYESYLQATAVHQGSVGIAIAGTLPRYLGDLPKFTTIDLSIGTGKGKWKVDAYAENVFNKRGVLGTVVQCPAPYCLYTPRVYTVTPMNFGVKFSQRF
jgi:outer membrane receptor protein involved in Fe transport